MSSSKFDWIFVLKQIRLDLRFVRARLQPCRNVQNHRGFSPRGTSFPVYALDPNRGDGQTAHQIQTARVRFGTGPLGLGSVALIASAAQEPDGRTPRAYTYTWPWPPFRIPLRSALTAVSRDGCGGVKERMTFASGLVPFAPVPFAPCSLGPLFPALLTLPASTRTPPAAAVRCAPTRARQTVCSSRPDRRRAGRTPACRGRWWRRPPRPASCCAGECG